MTIQELRQQYHREICRDILGLKEGVPSLADKGSKTSVAISLRLVEILGYPLCQAPPDGQTAGALFSQLTMSFINASFTGLHHLRSGDWIFSASQADAGIAAFDQYEHLAALDALLKRLKNEPALSTALSGDYLITPDIVIGRKPVTDATINSKGTVIADGDKVSTLTPLRIANNPPAGRILHASVSCKWTIRSDRAQNTRTEALNLIRNRKGRTPHIMAVTAEPMPTRLSSIAVGTGDIDCVYHMALAELVEAVKKVDNLDQLEVLMQLVHGRRLRDISDLPFDLAV